MKLPTAPYCDQVKRWPATGRHILAQYDEHSIIVYQAYSSEIGSFAAAEVYFGGAFRLNRMSWIKPNFLWMMHRSDWGKSADQETVLAIRLRRQFFDRLLEQAVPSSFAPDLFENQESWKAAVANSDVRLQWDPDHDPHGGKCERRAVQLGLRGDTLAAYAKAEILEIIDISSFVATQRENRKDWQTGTLLTPSESVYMPSSDLAAANVRLSKWSEPNASGS